MICSTTCFELRVSNVPGVAETSATCGTRSRNSAKLSGRLSSAEGSRKPKSTSDDLRERSPSSMPPICGIVWCDSSIDDEEVAREVVEQGERRGALRAPVEDPRVVLDAVAVAELAHHLHVVLGALAQAMGLEHLARALELLEAPAELGADLLDRALDRRPRRHVVRRRVDDELVASCRRPRP